MTASMVEAALAADAAGLCVVPPLEDGSKAPLTEWKQFQERRPTEDELLAWYANGRTGVGLVCGRVSGGLEMFEFEGRAVAEGLDKRFRELATAAGLGEVLDRILHGYVETTPKGGFHLLYRVPNPRGSTPLARRPSTAEELEAKPGQKVQVLIETKAEGGYTITAPSNGRVHPDGGSWTRTHGSFATIATITDEERDELYTVARSLDRMPVVPPRPPAKAWTGPEGTSPIDKYNAQPDIERITEDLLVRAGWSVVWRHGTTTALRRPGKDGPGISATLGHYPGTFFCFSTATEFEDTNADRSRPYDPAGVLAVLEYGGDMVAMGKALAEAEGLRWSTPEPPPETEEAGEPEADESPPVPAPGDPGIEDEGPPLAHPEDSLGVDLTANSMRSALIFAEQHGHRVRYDHSRKRWLTFERHHWKPDMDGRVHRLWMRTLKRRAAAAVNDKEAYRAVGNQMSAAAIKGGIELTRTIRPIASNGVGWDSDPYLLGVENGVVDLRTGALRDGKPEDMVTKTTGIAYEASATCPKFTAALCGVFRDDQAVVGWVQRLLGCGLTGIPTVDTLAFLTGEGSNGKSTLVDIVRATVGDYAAPITFSVLTSTDGEPDRATTSKMVARGGRLLFAQESGKEAQLNDRQLKEWSSGDQMSGRALYQDTVHWEPTHTLIAVCNVIPSLKAFDHASKRRIAIVHFPETFRDEDDPLPGPRKDYGLLDALRAERQGVLAWVVRGAVGFLQTRTLHPYPPAVAVSTTSFLDRNDILGHWMRKRVVVDPKGWIAQGSLWGDFLTWCSDNDESSPFAESATFGKAFKDRASRDIRGAEQKQQGHEKLRGWTGIGFAEDPE